MTTDQNNQMGRTIEDIDGILAGEEDFIVAPEIQSSSDIGPIFLEGILHDRPMGQDIDYLTIQDNLEKRLSSTSFTFELSKDILVDSDNAPSALGHTLYEYCKHALKELKVVENSLVKARNICYSAPGTIIHVQLYTLGKTERVSEEGSKLPQAEITCLPHIQFHGLWDELVFEDNFKRELIWIMTNILRFAQTSSDELEEPDMSPIIMLHGPPGTGKTSLCQALAQKISIRLGQTYGMTKLVQVKSATLLSKYFSESAKVIEDVFTKLVQMSRDKPNEFICVLIDEIESLAMSRETSTRQGECHDALRAVNAVLTGLDGAKGCRNIIFLCTTNMIGHIDSAFLDRCGLVLAIKTPSPVSQYTILRGKIQKLIDKGRVFSTEEIPYYDEALVDARIDSNRPGSKLLQIIELIRLTDAPSSSRAVSCRSLSQLPGQAMLRYLRRDECDLDMLFRFMEQSALTNRGQDTLFVQHEEGAKAGSCIKEDISGRKRKIHLIIENPDEEDIEACKRFLGTVKVKEKSLEATT